VIELCDDKPKWLTFQTKTIAGYINYMQCIIDIKNKFLFYFT